jgi:hypothetical protein
MIDGMAGGVAFRQQVADVDAVDLALARSADEPAQHRPEPADLRREHLVLLPHVHRCAGEVRDLHQLAGLEPQRPFEHAQHAIGRRAGLARLDVGQVRLRDARLGGHLVLRHAQFLTTTAQYLRHAHWLSPSAPAAPRTYRTGDIPLTQQQT